MSAKSTRAKKRLRVMVIGAHPDDCDLRAGGSAAKWAAAGHRVLFVSATNGQSGHHVDSPSRVVQRRTAEAKAACDVIGVESQVLPIPCGQMEPTLVYRLMFIRTIRRFAPDLILTHRPNDYHPDHRYTSQLVQDSSYLVRVPYNAPEVPPLGYSPVIAYLYDHFQKPWAFQPDFVIAIDDVMDKKMKMLHQHTSQMYEWIPWTQGQLDQVPRDQAGRKKFLLRRWAPLSAKVADLFRPQLLKRYGHAKGQAVKYAEAFEICEYGGKLSRQLAKALFEM